MKEIVVLSGKGGTGKTSITAALASVVENAVFCDCDVDAADLHLIFNPTVKEKHVFQGAWEASIDKDKCTACGICVDECRFDAIHSDNEGCYEVNAFQCEGCRLCEKVCPSGAITSVRSDKNHWFISNTRFGTLVHAQMGPGEENSGKLVSEVRTNARTEAEVENSTFIVNDGPPGIGCAVISSLTGVDAVLLVIESTKSGFHDASRLLELIRKFDIETYALINKFDINVDITTTIEAFLKEQNIPLLAKIPFDKTMVEAMTEGKTIVEYAPDSYIAGQIKAVWQMIKSGSFK